MFRGEIQDGRQEAWSKMIYSVSMTDHHRIEFFIKAMIAKKLILFGESGNKLAGMQDNERFCNEIERVSRQSLSTKELKLV
jgi:hypothetical protein